MKNLNLQNNNYQNLPNEEGFFGKYGGQFVPPELKEALKDVVVAYEEAKNDPEFQKEYQTLLSDYVGRPSPLFFAKNLTEKLGGPRIYL